MIGDLVPAQGSPAEIVSYVLLALGGIKGLDLTLPPVLRRLGVAPFADPVLRQILEELKEIKGATTTTMQQTNPTRWEPILIRIEDLAEATHQLSVLVAHRDLGAEAAQVLDTLRRKPRG